MHTGTVKSVQNKSITLEIDGKQVDFDVSPRVLIFNVSNSNKDTILQLNNTVVVRFRMEGNINNEAISISKIDFTGSLLNPRADVVIDKNIILLNGSPDKDSFDIVGDITEIDGGNITIKAELTGEYIVFDTNNSNFLVALNTDISNITSQTLAKIWAKETNSHFKSALVTLYR